MADKQQNPVNQEMNPVNLHFVISAPRSGSTWLTKALNQHEEIFASEHRLFGEYCEVWKNNDGSTTPRLTFDSFAREFATHYFYGGDTKAIPGRNSRTMLGLGINEFIDEFQIEFGKFMVQFAQTRSGKQVVVDKITPYPGTAFLVAEKIDALYSESKIIHLVRDGRDVLTSGAFDWLLKDADGTKRHEFFVGQRAGMELKRFFDDELIEQWALNWKESIDAFSGARQHTRVTYENMKADLPTELTRICAALGVNDSIENAARCSDQVTFEKMAGRPEGEAIPTAKARKGIVGDWKSYFTRADGELFDSLAGEQLVELGYETSRDWVSDLPKELELIQR